MSSIHAGGTPHHQDPEAAANDVKNVDTAGDQHKANGKPSTSNPEPLNAHAAPKPNSDAPKFESTGDAAIERRHAYYDYTLAQDEDEDPYAAPVPPNRRTMTFKNERYGYDSHGQPTIRIALRPNRAQAPHNNNREAPQRRKHSFDHNDIEAQTTSSASKCKWLKTLCCKIASEQGYIAAVMLFIAGAASCMTASLMDSKHPSSIAAVLFQFLLGILNTYCTLFVPNFRDRSSLPHQIGLFTTCVVISNVAYVVAIALWFRTQLGMNIALDVGALFQVIAVAVFAYTALEERKLLVAAESEQRDEWKKFDEKKALQKHFAQNKAVDQESDAGLDDEE